jgi:hypothetical protein
LNPIERFWKKLRRRATRNRLFDNLVDLKALVRNSLRYFQTVRIKVQTLLTGRRKRLTKKGDSFSGFVYEKILMALKSSWLSDKPEHVTPSCLVEMSQSFK